jgi:hypothetical protein
MSRESDIEVMGDQAPSTMRALQRRGDAQGIGSDHRYQARLCSHSRGVAPGSRIASRSALGYPAIVLEQGVISRPGTVPRRAGRDGTSARPRQGGGRSRQAKALTAKRSTVLRPGRAERTVHPRVPAYNGPTNRRLSAEDGNTEPIEHVCRRSDRNTRCKC